MSSILLYKTTLNVIAYHSVNMVIPGYCCLTVIPRAHRLFVPYSIKHLNSIFKCSSYVLCGYSELNLYFNFVLMCA